MRRLREARALAFAAALAVASGGRAPALERASDLDIGVRAYTDIITRFWTGTASQGHPKYLGDGRTPVGRDAPEVKPAYGNLWAYLTVVNALHACWKHCPAAEAQDAHTRIEATWTWMQTYWSAANMNVCGSTAQDPAAVAEDDVAWDALGLLQIQEATGSAKAGAWAQDLLKCGWDRWRDDVTGGGLYYDDSRTTKSSYQAQYALDLLIDHEQNKNAISLARAKEIERWAAIPTASCNCLYQSNLGLWWADVSTGLAPQWSSATSYNAGQIVKDDGAYFKSSERFNQGHKPSSSPSQWRPSSPPVPEGKPVGAELPHNIFMAGSSTFLAGNMAWAVVEARLYALSCATRCDSLHQARARQTAAGIMTYETLPKPKADLGANPFGTILLDDRDAFTNATDAYDFAKDVVPLLADSQAWIGVYQATARSVGLTARDEFGGYSGDWQGQTHRWEKVGNGSTSHNLMVSVQAALWPIVALKWAKP